MLCVMWQNDKIQFSMSQQAIVDIVGSVSSLSSFTAFFQSLNIKDIFKADFFKASKLQSSGFS